MPNQISPAMFGIDMEETMDLDLPETTKKVPGAGKTSRKAAKQSKAKAAKRKPCRKTACQEKSKSAVTENSRIEKTCKTGG